jgi:predicted nucleic acid-binding protein
MPGGPDGIFLSHPVPSSLRLKGLSTAPNIRKKYGLSHDQIERLILLLEKDAVVVPGLSSVAGAIPKDPDDEIFLAAAVDAKADIIVSGDRHLLDLSSYQDILIFTVRQFLERLEKQ